MSDSPSRTKLDVLESFPDGSPKTIQFHEADLQWIREAAIEEWKRTSPNFRLEGMLKDFTTEEFRIFCIAWATMRWMHRSQLVKETANVQFSRAYSDSYPDAEIPDWDEPGSPE